jgi:hypothetical protein
VTTDVVGLWLWPLTALYVIRIVKGGNPRLWLAVGAIVGVGLECKYSILFFTLAIVAALAMLPERRVLFNRWFVFAALMASAIALPNFLWQAQHGYPMWTLLNDAHEDQNVSLSLPQYLLTQILITHPLLAPVWIVGLGGLFAWRRERFLGIAYVLLIAAMVALHGKHYYPGAVYSIPIAAGAVVIARWTATQRKFLRPALLAYVFVAGVILVPLLMPVLSEPAMAAYDSFPQRFLGNEIKLAKTDHTRMGNLPPDWSDMLGWDALAATVARIYDSLPPSERAQAAILASNYGEASAIDFFGPQYGLPPVLSGHNQFWLWGTHGYTGNVIIDVHGTCEHGTHLFREERVVTHFSNPWGRPLENGFPISLCEGISMPLADYWPKLRAYI